GTAPAERRTTPASRGRGSAPANPLAPLSRVARSGARSRRLPLALPHGGNSGASDRRAAGENLRVRSSVLSPKRLLPFDLDLDCLTGQLDAGEAVVLSLRALRGGLDAGGEGRAQGVLARLGPVGLLGDTTGPVDELLHRDLVRLAGR